MSGIWSSQPQQQQQQRAPSIPIGVWIVLVIFIIGVGFVLTRGHKKHHQNSKKHKTRDESPSPRRRSRRRNVPRTIDKPQRVVPRLQYVTDWRRSIINGIDNSIGNSTNDTEEKNTNVSIVPFSSATVLSTIVQPRVDIPYTNGFSSSSSRGHSSNRTICGPNLNTNQQMSDIYLGLTGGVQLRAQSRLDPSQGLIATYPPLVSVSSTGTLQVFSEDTFHHLLHELCHVTVTQSPISLFGWVLASILAARNAPDDTLLTTTRALMLAQRDSLLSIQDDLIRIQTELDSQIRTRLRLIRLADAASAALMTSSPPSSSTSTPLLLLQQEEKEISESVSYKDVSFEMSESVSVIMTLLQAYVRVFLDTLSAMTRADIPFDRLQCLLVDIHKQLPSAVAAILRFSKNGEVGIQDDDGRDNDGLVDDEDGNGISDQKDGRGKGLLGLWRHLVGGDQLMFNSATSNAVWTQLLVIEGLLVAAAILFVERNHAIPDDPDLAVAYVARTQCIIHHLRHIYAPRIPTTRGDIWIVMEDINLNKFPSVQVIPGNSLSDGIVLFERPHAPITRIRDGHTWFLNPPLATRANLFTYNEAPDVAKKAIVTSGITTDDNLHARGWSLPSVDDVQDLLSHRLIDETDAEFLVRHGFATNLNSYLGGTGLVVRFWTCQYSMVVTNEVGSVVFRPVDDDTLASVFAVKQYKFDHC